MRSSLRWLCFLLFVLLLPIWLLLLVPKLNGFTAESLKESLRHEAVYRQVSDVLQRAAASQSTDEESGIEIDQATNVLLSALTPSYLQQKSEVVIDESAAWITGASSTEPVLVLNDLRDHLLATYPDAEAQLQALQRELDDARQQLADQPVDGALQESSEAESALGLAAFLQQADSLDNFIAGDFTLRLGTTLEPLKQAYQWYVLAVWVLGAFLFLLFVAVVGLSTTWLQRAKWASWTLLVTGLWNGLLAAGFSVVFLRVGIEVVSGMIPGGDGAVSALLRALTQSVFAGYAGWQLFFTGALLGFGALLMIVVVVMRKRHQSPEMVTAVPDDRLTEQPTSEVRLRKV